MVRHMILSYLNFEDGSIINLFSWAQRILEEVQCLEYATLFIFFFQLMIGYSNLDKGGLVPTDAHNHLHQVSLGEPNS